MCRPPRLPRSPGLPSSTPSTTTSIARRRLLPPQPLPPPSLRPRGTSATLGCAETASILRCDLGVHTSADLSPPPHALPPANANCLFRRPEIGGGLVACVQMPTPMNKGHFCASTELNVTSRFYLASLAPGGYGRPAKEIAVAASWQAFVSLKPKLQEVLELDKVTKKLGKNGSTLFVKLPNTQLLSQGSTQGPYLASSNDHDNKVPAIKFVLLRPLGWCTSTYERLQAAQLNVDQPPKAGPFSSSSKKKDTHENSADEDELDELDLNAPAPSKKRKVAAKKLKKKVSVIVSSSSGSDSNISTNQEHDRRQDRKGKGKAKRVKKKGGVRS
ncbi:hypothetical protein JCM8097_001824 [Rhodosporidiobolus ruineniae]